jgi:hypothetical protein
LSHGIFSNLEVLKQKRRDQFILLAGFINNERRIGGQELSNDIKIQKPDCHGL